MRKNKTKGFTLIELLIVIAIIAILAAVLIPNVIGARKRANDSATQSYMRQVATYVESYLAADPTNTVADIAGEGAGSESDECNTVQELLDEGLNSTYPASVTSCAVVNDGVGGYGVKAQSTTGNWFTLYAGQFKNQENTEPTGDPADW